MDQTVADALGTKPVAYGLNGMDAFVVLTSEAEVRRVQPDFRQLGKVGVRGVIVTAQAVAGKSYNFVSRFFAPGSGIDEDPCDRVRPLLSGPVLGRTAREVPK